MDGLGMVTMRFLKGIFIVHHMTSMIKILELGALFWEKLARQWFITEVTHS